MPAPLTEKQRPDAQLRDGGDAHPSVWIQKQCHKPRVTTGATKMNQGKLERRRRGCDPWRCYQRRVKLQDSFKAEDRRKGRRDEKRGLGLDADENEIWTNNKHDFFNIVGDNNNYDPLSLFLFVLVVDVLNRMIREAVRNGRISPLLVGRDNIELSHLKFADDTILFCSSDEETARNYKRLLRCFEMMSDLSINFEKSNLILVNCSQEWARQMCQLLDSQEAALPVRYLGISLGANSRLVKTWKPVINKVEEKLSLWKGRVLSKAGKLVLIKWVINSLSIYYLSLYKMPKAVARKIISMQKRFFWGKDDRRPGMAPVKWEMIQAPKKLGGLGVGDAVVRNAALLFEWWWRFSKEECTLWKKIVCSCNNLNLNHLLPSQKLPERGGPWRDICQLQIEEQHVRQKMIDGLTMEVGDGRSTRFWKDT
ncbi:uncharacterized protein LOC107464586 [Arachis duranensis]|uniref:Uncharacterized protein LOC107464586 n=1 Tax=Arachis duranensis TaxID=130453 RepID=A0A6P4BK07_ARADU|nr:uncharacterized protein LOC107464586 [Arachis duranensis]